MARLKVLSIASEAFPLVKTGGLADVAGALPIALKREEVETRTLLPAYPAVKAKLKKVSVALDIPDLFGAPARILAGSAGGLDLFALDAPHLYERAGNIYLGADGFDWRDNAIRFAALARAGADIGLGAIPAYAPDVVHAHDWQAALAPAYLHYAGRPRPGSMLTIHNLAFQGHYPMSVFAQLGLPDAAVDIDGVEYFGGVGFLKAGIRLADTITTVSPTYAAEIKTPEFGMALDGLLRSRALDLHGVRNGIDEEVWDPATDSALPQPYDARRLDQREGNKLVLQRRVGLTPDAARPLFGVVSRLSDQKGIDLLIGALSHLVGLGGQLALLGAGDRGLEQGFAAAAATYPGSVGCVFGYDEALAHLFQAGSDFIVVPSRFEPCGLTQLCALRYGAAPLVSRVGGLNDTVIDANDAAVAAGVATGVQFAPPSVEALSDAIRHAVNLYRDPEIIGRMRLNGMGADVSWRLPARRYASLFRAIAGPVG
jgi:starch synthase